MSTLDNAQWVQITQRTSALKDEIALVLMMDNERKRVLVRFQPGNDWWFYQEDVRFLPKGR